MILCQNSFAKPRVILYMPGLVQSLARASYITDAVTDAVADALEAKAILDMEAPDLITA